MAFNDRLVTAGQATTPTIDGVTAGNVAAGATLIMNKVKRNTLSSTVTVDAETDTITLTAVWQVSVDTSTWVDLYQPNSAAYVVQATGTGGADAAVTRVIDAPGGVYGWRYARIVILVGVATGTSADSSAVDYNYQHDNIE